MATVIDTFTDWFKRLTPEEQAKLWEYIHSQQGMTGMKGLFVGPAPSATSGTCPNCGRRY